MDSFAYVVFAGVAVVIISWVAVHFFCATCPEPRRDEWLARTERFRRYPIALRAGGGTFTERLQARQLAPLR